MVKAGPIPQFPIGIPLPKWGRYTKLWLLCNYHIFVSWLYDFVHDHTYFVNIMMVIVCQKSSLWTMFVHIRPFPYVHGLTICLSSNNCTMSKIGTNSIYNNQFHTNKSQWCGNEVVRGSLYIELILVILWLFEMMHLD